MIIAEVKDDIAAGKVAQKIDGRHQNDWLEQTKTGEVFKSRFSLMIVYIDTNTLNFSLWK